MNKKIIIFLIVLFLPIRLLAISNNYVDKLSDITSSNIEEEKINIYLFYGQECPHCEEERIWLDNIIKEYDNKINVYYFEVWHNDENVIIMNKAKKKLEITSNNIPLTIISDKYYVGFSNTVASRIEENIKEYLELNSSSNMIKLPLLGNVNMKEVSIPLVTIILGLINGFNPCSMWVLLFLINMLFGIKSKKKSWIIGFSFLFVSFIIYFLSLLGINILVDVTAYKWMKIIIGLIILVVGILNIRKYIKMRKEEVGCEVVSDKKRKKIIDRIKKVIESKTLLLAIIGVSILAASINVIGLACSLGFPLVFNELLTINEINGISKIIYLLLFTLFYLLDDIIIFVLSMITLESKAISNKYTKLTTIISAIIMIIIGILLIFKPEWLMLNF